MKLLEFLLTFFYISDALSWFQIDLRFKIIQKCVELVRNVLFLEKKPTENNIEKHIYIDILLHHKLVKISL